MQEMQALRDSQKVTEQQQDQNQTEEPPLEGEGEEVVIEEKPKSVVDSRKSKDEKHELQAEKNSVENKSDGDDSDQEANMARIRAAI